MLSSSKIFLFCILCILSTTMTGNCQQDVPAGSWEQLPHSIEAAVTLVGDALTAYVKNTSNAPLKIVGGEKHLVYFFYIDANRKRVLLTDKLDVDDDSRKVPGSAIIPPGGAQIFHSQIALTAEQLTAIQGCLVMCRFTIEATTQQYFKMETTPKVLK